MTLGKLKISKKKKDLAASYPLKYSDDYPNDDRCNNDGTSAIERRRPVSQPHVLTPPDLLGEHAAKDATKIDTNASPWKRHKLFQTPFPRYRHSASAVASDKNELFVMGGFKDGAVFGDTWRVVPQVSPSGRRICGFVAQPVQAAGTTPPARVGHASVLCGNAFIVYGGDTVDSDAQGCPDDNFYMFNTDSGKYTSPLHIGNKPNGRYGHLAVVVLVGANNSCLYVFGGQLESQVYNDMYSFELNTFKLPHAHWKLVEPLHGRPPHVTNHSMCAHRTKLYVFGGVNSYKKVSRDLWCFDTLVRTWQQVRTTGDAPPPVNEHAACLVGDIMYVHGGNDGAGTNYENLYALDLVTHRWTKLPAHWGVKGPGPRCGHTLSYIPRLDKLVVMGGNKNDYARASKHEFAAYDDPAPGCAATMVFELDLRTANQHMDIARPIKRAASVGAAAGLASRRRPLPLPSKDKLTHHRRSRSNFADYRTPHGSSDHPLRALDPTGDDDFHDRFVDVPSSATSAYLDSVNPNDTQEHPVDRRNTSDCEGPYHGWSLDSAAGLASPALPGLTENTAPNSLRTLIDTSIHAEDIAQPSERSLDARSVPGDEGESIEKNTSGLHAQIAALQKEIPGVRAELADERTGTAEQKNAQVRALKTRDTELRDALGPDAWRETDEVQDASETTRLRLVQLKLRNRLAHTEHENAALRAKQLRFEPFMNNQMDELGAVQKTLQAHEERVAFLTDQLRLEQVLSNEIARWKHAHDDLERSFDHYRVLYGPGKADGTENTDKDADSDADAGRTGKDAPRAAPHALSTRLAELVAAWQTAAQIQPQTAPDTLAEKLQKQVDDLMRVVRAQHEQAAGETQELRRQLETTRASLLAAKQKYKEAMQAARTTSDALGVTGEKLQLRKAAYEKLAKAHNELRLQRESAVHVGGTDAAGADAVPDAAAHFRMKIKELEAELFVARTDNENLTAQVAALRKELYMATK